MDRLQHLRPRRAASARSEVGLALALCALLCACDEGAPEQRPQTSSRFAAVKSERDTPKAASVFCERVFPVDGPEARRFVDPPAKAIPGYASQPAQKDRWRWVNLWATWCVPCIEEMALLGKWKTALEKDGVPLDLELLSIDEEEKALVEWLKRPMPGRVTWLRSQEDLGPLLESLGADKGSAIPVHALVDPDGRLRCVRVGGVRDGDYPSVKALLAAR